MQSGIYSPCLLKPCNVSVQDWFRVHNLSIVIAAGVTVHTLNFDSRQFIHYARKWLENRLSQHAKLDGRGVAMAFKTLDKAQQLLDNHKCIDEQLFKKPMTTPLCNNNNTIDVLYLQQWIKTHSNDHKRTTIYLYHIFTSKLITYSYLDNSFNSLNSIPQGHLRMVYLVHFVI